MAEAFVTLATNDSYALGSIVWANSLRNVNTTKQICVMITDGVSPQFRQALARVADHVELVQPLDSSDPANLALLGRPNLGCTFTKLHCWRLIRYTKAVFMDSDTLVLANIDDLFEREELSAAPDPGWPDCFNSGVFVYRPSEDTYRRLIEFANNCTSFDGADQGLLNLFFNDWATKDIAKHLPFTYNCVSQAFYSYLPAFRHFRRDIKVAHFIGEVKPWHHSYNSATGLVEPREGTGHQSEFLQHWWDIYVTHVHTALPAGARLLVDSPELAETIRQRRRVLAVVSGGSRLIRLRQRRLVRRLEKRRWGWPGSTAESGQRRLVDALLLPSLSTSSAAAGLGRKLRLARERTFCAITRQPLATTVTTTTTGATTTRSSTSSSVVVFKSATLPAADCAGAFTRHTFVTPVTRPDPNSVHSVRIKNKKTDEEKKQLEAAAQTSRWSRVGTTTVTITAAALADRLFEALHLEPPAMRQRSQIRAPPAEIDDSYIEESGRRVVDEFDESTSEFVEEYYDEYYDEADLPVEAWMHNAQASSQGGRIALSQQSGGGGGAVASEGAVGGGDRRLAWERGEIDYLGSDRFDNVLSHLKDNIQD